MLPDQLGLSTCWAADASLGGESILKQISRTGLCALELEYRLTSRQIHEMLLLIRAHEFKVWSVHNFTPVPPELPPEKASGELFNLAALDKEERLIAVQYTERSLELASEVEAKALVLHLGSLPGRWNTRPIHDAARQGEMIPDLAKQVAARTQDEAQALDAASFALEKLIRRAAPLGVTLALENRFHAFELPSLNETGLLLRRFAGAPLAPWLDIGHAYIQGRAGLPGVDEWLDAFEGELLGCHLHDAVGCDDHKAPGQGDVDWESLAPRLASTPIKIMEIHSGPTAEEITQAAEMLSGLFAQAKVKQEESAEEGLI